MWSRASYFLGLQFLICKIWEKNNKYLPKLSWRLTETRHVKCLAYCQKDGIPLLAAYWRCVLPVANAEIRFWVQVVYLGDNPSKYWQKKSRSEMGKERQQIMGAVSNTLLLWTIEVQSHSFTLSFEKELWDLIVLLYRKSFLCMVLIYKNFRYHSLVNNTSPNNLIQISVIMVY